MIKEKKGISAVVATVLMIVITLAAVAIIWTAVLPLISEPLDKTTVCIDAVSQLTIKDDFTFVDDAASPRTLSLQVSNGPNELDLSNLQVVVSSEGSTTSFDVVGKAHTVSDFSSNATSDDLPGPNLEKRYYFDIDDISGEVDSISIAPVVSVGNEDHLCAAANTLDKPKVQ